jgi:type IV secretory pathway TraG/TraD family ATPase VirD4
MSDQAQGSSDSILEAFLGVGLALLCISFGLPVLAGWYFWKNPTACSAVSWKVKAIVSSILILLGCMSWYLWLDARPLYEPDLLHEKLTSFLLVKNLVTLLWVWVMSCVAIWILSPLFRFFKKSDNVLRLSDFGVQTISAGSIKENFKNPSAAPIGVNVKTGQVESLEEKRRCSHVLILGATGSGKSTLMFNLILHAVKHGQPVLIIDPKGEMGSLNHFLDLARTLDPNFDQRFRLFSMGAPETSASYNPLRNGSATEKKDRILEALNWSEQFYQSISGSYLSALLSAIEMTETPLTLDYLEKIAIHKPTQSELLKKLAQVGKSGNAQAEGIFNALGNIFEKRGNELLGLQAQISILNNATLGPLLSNEKVGNSIDLHEVLEKKQIAYFQLNTLGNADTARRLGRMIIEDAKALAHHVYNTVLDEKKRTFFPIFIDEFGSFAAKEFIEFLKQSRGARFGIHMFCQGLEDLDVVSPEFRRQSISNPMTTISLRVVDNETVNEVAAIAGTIDALEQSYQVQGKMFRTKTGMGNLRHTKQMRVEHDVLRNLENLQGVVIKKSPSQIDGIQVFFPEILVE